MLERPIEYSDFQKVDMRVGTVTRCEEFAGARSPAYKLWIDFGSEIGIKKTSAQVTDLYQADELVGNKVVAVVNLSPKQIGDFMSEVLVLGAVPADGKVVLLTPTFAANNGVRIG